MNKRQKEMLQLSLKDEKEIIRKLKLVYSKAAKDCEEKICLLNARADMQNLQAVIYQKRYQQALKSQIDSISSKLQDEEFDTISEYLSKCYEDGYIGTLYDLHGQGIPITTPINQSQVVKAIQIDSKISSSLYTKLGEDVSALKKSIQTELSRGIANGSSWIEIADQIANGMNSPYKTAMNNSIRIARTEGHRVQQEAQHDAQVDAKESGADIVKEWDATLDERTRPEHQELNGQIREIDEEFEVDGYTAMMPGGFGDPYMDCNCRCVANTRARWNLDYKQTEHLGHTERMSDADLTPIAEKLNISVDELRKYSDQTIPSEATDYEDFRQQYEAIWNYKTVPRS